MNSNLSPRCPASADIYCCDDPVDSGVMLCPVKVRRGGNTERLQLATGFVPVMSSNSMFRFRQA
jgi:hypothetical protein